jgi:uncharacterized protein YdaU (DUF1376 family)
MPLYVGDYLADTSHLTTAEHGAYILLICHYWRNEGLPDKDEQRRRISKMTVEEWAASRDTIAEFFDADWKHKRIEFELTEAARLSAAGRAGGKASGEARRTTVERPLNDQGNVSPTKREALQSQSHTQKEEKKEAGADAPRLKATRLPDDWFPSDDNLIFAERRGLSVAEIDTEHIKFRNYWTAKSGKDATKLNWSRTWENWILNRRGTPNGHAKSPNGLAGALARLRDDIAADERSQEGGRPPLRLLSSG